jgi:hypothetical protein
VFCSPPSRCSSWALKSLCSLGASLSESSEGDVSRLRLTLLRRLVLLFSSDRYSSSTLNAIFAIHADGIPCLSICPRRTEFRSAHHWKSVLSIPDSVLPSMHSQDPIIPHGVVTKGMRRHVQTQIGLNQLTCRSIISKRAPRTSDIGIFDFSRYETIEHSKLVCCC